MSRSSLGLCLAVAAFIANATFASAQTPSQPGPQAGPAIPVAPVPPGILNARTIFISNAGADGGLFPHPFSGDPNRGYAQFYAALQERGQYQLVADPSQADLVLELRLIAPYGPSNGNKVRGAADPLPEFRLFIYDAGPTTSCGRSLNPLRWQ